MVLLQSSAFFKKQNKKFTNQHCYGGSRVIHILHVTDEQLELTSTPTSPTLPSISLHVQLHGVYYHWVRHLSNND